MHAILQPQNNNGCFSVLQISDMHLYEQEDAKLLGVDTAKSFQAVIDAIKKQNKSFDMILATGDLSQDYSEGSYVRFAKMIKNFSQPVYWLPGNHDDGPKMARVMPSLGISNAKNIIIGNWQFILLNTQVYSSPMGWAEPSQLAFIKECINSHPELHVAVCLHHNAFSIESTWLDQHELKNKKDLVDLIHNNTQVKLILCGHVHQERDFFDDSGVRFISSPATSIQFTPYSFNFSLDALGPGWRYLTFYPDGHIETEVHRVPFEQFVPDFAIGGY